MNVLVTGAGSRIGQAIIKLIKKIKINISIFSTDYTKESIGFIGLTNSKFYQTF